MQIRTGSALLITLLGILLVGCERPPPEPRSSTSRGLTIEATSWSQSSATLQYEIPLSVNLTSHPELEARLADIGVRAVVLDERGPSGGSVALVTGTFDEGALLLVDKLGAAPSAVVFHRPVVLIGDVTEIEARSVTGLRGVDLELEGAQASIEQVEIAGGSVSVTIRSTIALGPVWATQPFSDVRLQVAGTSAELTDRVGSPTGGSWIETFSFDEPRGGDFQGSVTLKVRGPQAQFLGKVTGCVNCAR